MSLKPEQLDFFSERGYLPFGRVYSEEGVEELRRALDEVRSEETEKVAMGARAEGAVVVSFNLAQASGKETPSLVRMFRVHNAFRRHVFNPKIAEAIAQLLETDKLRLMEDQIIIKEPGISTPLHWHQDFVYWPMGEARQVSCWLALDYVTVDSGAMQFVPGSHTWGEYARVDFDTGEALDEADPLPRIPIDPKAEGHETVAVELDPGECVFHHSLTWHATEPNTSNRNRRGLITRFMAPTTYRPERSPGHPIAMLDGLTPGEPLEREDEFPLVWPR